MLAFPARPLWSVPQHCPVGFLPDSPGVEHFARHTTTPALASRVETSRVHAARFQLTAHLRRRPCSSARVDVQFLFSRASLLGLSKYSPSSTWLLRVHSRSNRGSIFGSGLPRPGLVPPLLFLRASTVYSAHQLAGLLRPAADHGVRHVSGWMTGQLSCGFARRSVSRARSQVDPGGSGATSWLASLTLHRQKSRCRVRGFPRRGPCPSTPSHASFRRFRQPDWGVALPRVPSSRAQLLPVDVAVNQRCICAPDPVLLMRPDFLSSSFLSQWRFTLRRFLLSSSRVVSPRPLPSRAFISGTARVAASGPTFGAPHGVAPL